MNKADVIRMAQEAGATIRQGHRLGVIVYEDCGNLSPMVLERFAELVAAAERERCAKECEKELMSEERFDFQRAHGQGVRCCAAAIRGLKDGDE